MLTACGASAPSPSAATSPTPTPTPTTPATASAAIPTATTSSASTIDKPIPNSSLVVTIPANAVFKKIGDPSEPDVEIDIAGEKGPALLLQGNKYGVIYGELAGLLEGIKGDQQTVVSETGTAKDFTVVFKPYAEQAIVNYARRFSAAGKDMACTVLSVPEGARDLIEQYDTICKSVRPKP